MLPGDVGPGTGKDEAVARRKGWGRALREFLYGMTSYEFEQHALDVRTSV
jgi:hypothetical protein